MLDIGRKLRAARLDRDFSLRELAAKAEVSASLLSQIENGKANPSVRSLHSIADALSLPVDYFFPSKNGSESETEPGSNVTGHMTTSELRAAQDNEPASNPALSFDQQESRSKSPIMRCGIRPTIELQGGVTWARLTPGPEEDAEFLQIRYDVGASSGTKMSHHPGREFGLILEGELLVELGFESYTLHQGDSIIFDSTTPHRLTNTGQSPVQALWIILNHD